MKRKDGYTLVELLVTIAASSIILLAAASLLLLGFRVLQSARKEAEEQQTVRIVLSVLEDMTVSGRFDRVQISSGGWQLLHGTDAILTYDRDSGCLSSGGAVLLEGLTGSSAVLEPDGKLLRFSFQTKNHAYDTAAYCRLVMRSDNEAENQAVVEEAEKKAQTEEKILPTAEELSDAVKTARYNFLQELTDQLGSTGQIAGSEQYFSEWYNETYNGSNPAWGPETPWCACFLSWAAAQQAASLNKVPVFADVDEGMAKFRDESFGLWGEARGEDPYTPIPGDYIFFDWSGGDDPDHVGAVLYVEESTGTVYTLEGNNGGRVTLCSYSLKDPGIVGYGILDWKEAA